LTRTSRQKREKVKKHDAITREKVVIKVVKKLIL